MTHRGILRAEKMANTPCYTSLTPRQKRIVKAYEGYCIAERYLYSDVNGFYKEVKRLPNNAVDWDSVSDNTMSWFEHSTKEIEKYMKYDDDEVNEAMKVYKDSQFRFGQSF